MLTESLPVRAHAPPLRMPDVKFQVYDDNPSVVCGCQSGNLPFYEPGLQVRNAPDHATHTLVIGHAKPGT